MKQIHFSIEDLKRDPHETIINIKLIEAMRKAGIPVVGKLIPSAVTHGMLVWQVEEDIDGDTLVITWYDRNESPVLTASEDEEL